MKNKNLIALWCCVAASLVISVVTTALHFLSADNVKTATEIYNECLYNVVEIKACSDGVGESFGTGEIISKNGRIITNAHVVTYTRQGILNEFDNYYIRFSYEDEYRSVSLVKYDVDLDVAVLQLMDLNKFNLKQIPIGDSTKIKSGEKVYAVGNAANYGIGIFAGIISIPLVNVELDGSTRSVIQCDLTIAAGNSGGALLNENGELIGITTFRTKDISGNVIYGIVYSIPINIVLDYVNQ